MYCDGTLLSMPRRVAVALLSNSDNEKCFESCIRIKILKTNTDLTDFTDIKHYQIISSIRGQ